MTGGRWLRVTGGLTALCVGLAVIAAGCHSTALALRLTGHPGTLTVDHCPTAGTGRTRTTTCYGVFAGADGFRDQQAHVGILRPARTLRVQRDGHGGYQAVGLQYALGGLVFAGCGAALCLAATALLGHPAGRRHVRRAGPTVV